MACCVLTGRVCAAPAAFAPKSKLVAASSSFMAPQEVVAASALSQRVNVFDALKVRPLPTRKPQGTGRDASMAERLGSGAAAGYVVRESYYGN